ncbi:MAG TPA: PSD1 and planctomycete cytochrome C domain-containing protein [Blastocatellia bacterium]|nr:PSD1 and planctomycete cytochrome C domain-containing protein [Blastocatellia bacterium]
MAKKQIGRQMMNTRACRLILLGGACLLVLARAGLPLTADDEELSRQAYAILKQNCLICHGAAKTSGLDLRSAASVRAGGDHGKVIVPSDADRSRLYRYVSHLDKPSMPPGKKLAQADIDTLRRWIDAGASFEGFEESGDDAASAGAIPERLITAEERHFWFFRPPKRTVVNSAPGTNPIDTFLLASLEKKGLKASPPADKRTLIRRAYLDLLGLPPSPEEVDAFVNDSSPDAWERVVDRLLASPHYGERWARHWLDLVRYADSGGFEFDTDRPDAWRYRDYVVKSFNDDKPYDRFVREQIAGDEFSPESPDATIATGFLRLGPEGGGGGERGRQDSLDDLVSTTSLTFMALTVGCARCHDHKFDPIPQKDYYRLQSVFFPTRPVSYPLVAPDIVARYRSEVQRIDSLERPLKRARTDLEAPYLKILVEEAVSRLPEYLQAAWRTPEAQRTEGQRLNVRQIMKTLQDDPLSARITEEDIIPRMSSDDLIRHKDLTNRIAEVEKQKPPPYATARAIGEEGREPRPSYFLNHGSIDSKGPAMTPGVLSVVSETEYAFPRPPDTARSSWRRRGLAEWLVSRDNPLTARVMVNRIWQHHFGEGIVRTPSNFGQMGERPSNPELLDWLALEFVEHGWSIKHMHRLMMTSRAYRMASNDVAGDLAIDPENRLVWRMPRERLEAEIIRDQMLAVAGNLDRKIGGPCVYPYIDPALFQSSTKRTWPGRSDDDPSTWRRSLYVYSKRSIRYPLFETFDQPNLINSCDRRNRSTISPQALLLMNNNLVIAESKIFADRLRREAGADVAKQVDRAYKLALGRMPQQFERTKAIEYIGSSKEGLAEFCQALFNLNEFVYRQ